MVKDKLINTLSIVLLCLLLTAVVVPKNRFFEIAKHIEIYSSLFKTLNEVYVDDVNPNHLLNTTVESMLAKLDPYTVYISEDKIEDYRTLSTGQYGGIGASTVRLEGHVFISAVVQEGPAYQAGIEVGDEVITAAGVLVLNKNNDELNQLVRGQAKTTIVLGIRKNGAKETINTSIVRDKITIKNVPYYGILTESVGYVKFTQFTENGSKNISKAIKELKKKGATSLILDLRSNPGGFLREAVNICNLFIPKDKIVVETKGKRSENSSSFLTLNQPIDLTIPVVILINRSSASASEIVSGTLQDYDRAVIMGQKSYGKGLVQNIRPLTYNAQLKVTIAKYYTASGRCIQALDYTNRNDDGSVGEVPDSLKTAYKTTNGRTVLDGGGVDPDILTDEINISELIIKLIQDGRIYTYANEFKLANNSIASPEKFNLSNSQFNDFVNWLAKYDIDYRNPLEKELIKMEELSQNLSKKSEVFSSTLMEIKEDVHTDLNEQLYREQDILKKLLEAEIALRYYNEEGGIEASLGDDNEIEKAISILKNPTEYNNILSGVKN
jgi:carboxyl-terminal processing protease